MISYIDLDFQKLVINSLINIQKSTDFSPSIKYLFYTFLNTSEILFYAKAYNTISCSSFLNIPKNPPPYPYFTTIFKYYGNTTVGNGLKCLAI